MKDMHNLGIFDSLVEVWDSYPYGGCPGDYVVIGGEVVYWNDERRVWGDFGSDISSDKNQIVEGNLTIEKNLTIGGDTKGNTADFKKIVAETLNIKNPPYALKVHNHDDVYALSKHKHQLEDIIESGEGVVVPGKIENAKYADVAYDLDKNSPGNRRFISRLNDDTASGHLTLEKGATSKGLFEANNGLVVRKTEVVEPMLMSLLSEEFEEGIVEENEDVFVEEMRTATGGAATLGELDNVTDEADSVSDTDDILVRLAGTSEWTINTALFSQVSQLMSKVFPFTMTLSGGGTYEKGSSQTINLSWTYDRDIESQSINNESLLIGIRAKQYANVATDTTYTLKAIQGGLTYTKSVSAQFKVKKYYGVSANGTLTNDEILSLSNTWAGRTQGSTVFDCTGGKYPYYILPTSMVSGIQFWIGGLRNTDWAEETREVTNAFGHKESYTIYRLNSIQTGVLNIEVK